MSAESFDVAVIGGGIIGLATALAVSVRHPAARLVVIEKEPRLADHQTGHNSGVLHSGIYYAPGSLKARLCRAGNEALVWFCGEHDIPFEVCGKVIVATETDELPRLAALEDRARAHGLEVERLGPAGLRDREPHVAGIAGLHVASTGIVDFRAVVDTYARLVRRAGGEIRLGTRVLGVASNGEHVLSTTGGEIRARWVVNCGGLHSDRLARLAGTDPGAQIVPFRGEYYELAPHARDLVRTLIYPVPDPQFPFLGVHFTKMIDGSVHAGPNAVLALSREGYRKRDVSPADTWEVVRYKGFRRLARHHARSGAAEIARSFSKTLFVRSLQRLVPEVRRGDLVPTHAGVRAQALAADGALVDDFLIVEGDRTVHVCNAPSPAATSSLPIGEHVAGHITLE